MARHNRSIFKYATRLTSVACLALVLAGCRWTSAGALLSKDDADWSPLKPGTYVHGDTRYEIDGRFSGPILVTTRVKDDSDTYSVNFRKLGGKFFLVQAVSGNEVNYLLILTNKDGFTEFRPACKDDDRAIALAAGAVLDENEACQFPSLDAVTKAANTAAEKIKSGGPGFPGDAFVRQN